MGWIFMKRLSGFWLIPVFAVMVMLSPAIMNMASTGLHEQNGEMIPGDLEIPGDIPAVESDITNSNEYADAGAPLTLREWADSQNTTAGISIVGTQTAYTDITLADGWTGYGLDTQVYSLYQTSSQFVQFYSFTADTNQGDLNNNGVWAYSEQNLRATGGEDLGGWVYTDLNPTARRTFTSTDNARWTQSVPIPRGTILQAWVAFDYYTGRWNGMNRCPFDDFKVYLEVNGQRVISIVSNDMHTAYNVAAQWGTTPLVEVPVSVVQGFPAMPGSISLRVGSLCASDWNRGVDEHMYTRFDNVRFYVKALTQPTQVGITVDVDSDAGGNRAINTITYGSGSLYFTPTPANWNNGTSAMRIGSVFRTTATNPVYSTFETIQEQGLETVAFNVRQRIFGFYDKQTLATSSLLSASGSTFTVSNSSTVDWTTYFYDRPPQVPGAQEDYLNYMFNGTKPSDWNIYQVLDSQPVDKTIYLSGRGAGSTFIEMPKEYAAYYGFWSFKASSPNYVANIAVNDTDIFEGDSIRFTGAITLGLADGYIDQTQANLTVKFPNGTVWFTQIVSVASDRSITFPAFTIPSSGPQYIAGIFTAVLSWDNSRTGIMPDEAGVKVMNFIVKHRATLTAAIPVMYDHFNTEQSLPVQLRFVDFGNNTITDATITFQNFDGVTQQFDFTNGFYNYITLLNCTNGPEGLNNLTITANSPSFEQKVIVVGVELVRVTSFSIDKFPSVSAQWNDNFSLVLNYTDTVWGTGIEISSASNITVDWPEAIYSVDMSNAANGIYTLAFNTSGALPGVSYTVPITIKEIMFQGKTIIMDISVTPRLASLNLVPIPDVAYGETMLVNMNFRETSTGSYISNTTGRIVGTAFIVETATPCTVTDLTGGYYAVSLDTWLLPSLGGYTLQVDFTWSGIPYYANQTRTLAINLVARSTQAYTSGTYDVKAWGQLFNVSLFYLDVINGTAISSGTNVHITISAWNGVTPLPAVAAGTSLVFDPGLGAWQLTFDATDFGQTNLAPGFTVNVDVGWTGGLAPYYINKSVTFNIKIDEAPTFLYIKDPSKQTAPAGDTHVLTFNFINQRTGTGINISTSNISVTSFGILPNINVFDPSTGIVSLGNGSYVLTFNISSIPLDYVSFNISINVQNYQDINDYSFTLIKISPIPIIEVLDIAQVHLDQQLDIKVFFHLIGSTDGIPNAVVNISANPSSGYWIRPADYEYSYDGTNYTIWFTPSFTHARVSSSGTYSVYLSFSSTQGNMQIRVNFNVGTLPTNISAIYFDGTDYTSNLPTYLAFIGDTVTLVATFVDTFNVAGITAATLTFNLGAFTGNFVPVSGGNYTIDIDTASFGTGPFVFTIVATGVGYTQASKQVKLDISAVSTDIELYLDGVSTDTASLYYSESITISFLYIDTHNVANITDAGTSIVLTGVPATWTLNGNFWEVTLDASAIGAPGTYFMTLTAGLTDYQTARATFVITVMQVPTKLEAYNETTGTLQNSFTMYWGSSFNVALNYSSLVSGLAIGGATVTASGSISPANSSAYGDWYVFTFDTSTFGPSSVYTITFVGSIANHTASSSLITVNVMLIPTDLVSYNGTVVSTSFVQFTGEIVNVNLQMISMLTMLPQTGVSFTTSHGSISEPVPASGNYTLQVNTSSWTGVGIVQVTILAQLANHVASSEVITINILPVSTAARVYINGADETETLQATIDYLDTFTITAYYNNTLKDLPITAATVYLTFTNISGTYIIPLDPVGSTGNYTKTLDSSILGAAPQYVFYLTAMKASHDSIFSRINIFLNPIPTALNVTHESVLLSEASTIDVVYSDVIYLTVELLSYLQGNSPLNGSNTTVVISAIVNQQNILATWNETISAYLIAIPTSVPLYGFTAGLTSQILVLGEADGYQSDTFSFLVNVEYIPTNIAVEINNTVLSTFLGTPVSLLDELVFSVYFNESYGIDAPLISASVELTFTNKTTGLPVTLNVPQVFFETYYSITMVLDVQTFGSGIREFYIKASRANYQTQQVSFSLNLNKINTTADTLVNGTTPANLGNLYVELGNTLFFSVGYDQVVSGTPVLGASVSVSFYNDVLMTVQNINLAYNGGTGNYETSLPLTLASFRSSLKAFTVTAQLAEHEIRVVQLTININKINTTIDTRVNGTTQANLGSLYIELGNTLLFSVGYDAFVAGTPVLGASVSLGFFNDVLMTVQSINLAYNGMTGNYETSLPLTLASFRSSLKSFTITAQLAEHEIRTAQVIININKINTTIVTTVNGTTQDINNMTMPIGSSLLLSVGYLQTVSSAPVTAAGVTISYYNDVQNIYQTQPLVYNAGSQAYTTMLNLSFNAFFASYKSFIITAQKDEHEIRTIRFNINIQKIIVETRLNMTGNVTGSTFSYLVGSTFTFRVNLFNTFSNASFVDIAKVSTVLCYPEYFEDGGNLTMVAELDALGNPTGTYAVTLTAPRVARTYRISVQIFLADPTIAEQFQFNMIQQFTLVVVAPPNPFPVEIVYLLFAVIIGLVAYFIAYQIRFKYPPMIRKIMDLRRTVARGKAADRIKPPKVLSREENIYTHYAKLINDYAFLQTKDTRYAAKAAGYAPTPDESISLDFEMPAIDGAFDIEAAPKKAKGYVAPPAGAVPGAVAPAPAVVKPVPGLTSLPKPAAVAPVPKPGGMPAPPTPVLGTPTPAVQPVPEQPPVPGAQPIMKPVTTPVTRPLPKPAVKAPPMAGLPKPAAPGAPGAPVPPAAQPRGIAPAPKPAATPAAGGMTQENLYQQLVLLEQKRYKAERSLRDLNAKHGRGMVQDSEYQAYQEKINATLDKIKDQITEIRRRLMSF